jgi:hypothetical protein
VSSSLTASQLSSLKTDQIASITTSQIKAIEVQAGPGAKSIQQLQPSSGGGVDTSNPLVR